MRRASQSQQSLVAAVAHVGRAGAWELWWREMAAHLQFDGSPTSSPAISAAELAGG